jgi:hypothetical protein
LAEEAPKDGDCHEVDVSVKETESIVHCHEVDVSVKETESIVQSGIVRYLFTTFEAYEVTINCRRQKNLTLYTCVLQLIIVA